MQVIVMWRVDEKDDLQYLQNVRLILFLFNVINMPMLLLRLNFILLFGWLQK